jgi:glycerol kinase
MACILAIDQSTSATKAMLYAAPGGEPLDSTSIEHCQIYPRPGWVEHDAGEIWDNVLDATTTVIKRNATHVSELLCLSITNQRETFVVFDRETGKPLGNAIVWQCRRGEDVCNELIDAGHEDEVRRRTGLRIDTYFSGPKLTWLLRNDPARTAKVASGAALVGTIDAYLLYRLTNGKVFATDHTNASRTLLYDIHALDWDDDLCRLFDVPRIALPDVRESASRFGETDLRGALPHHVPICGVMGDSQAALFAHGCFRRGMAKATFGTGSSVLLNVGHAAPESTGGAVTSLAWVIGNKPTYCLEGIINYSAATLAWLRDRLRIIESFDEVEPLATSVKDNGGVYLVPAFAGMGAPYWRADARAAIVGLTAHSGREHVVRAALESIAYQICDVVDMLREGADVDVNVLHADGGPTGNRFLMQFVADVIETQVKVASAGVCSALGAAMMGALGIGAIESVEALASLPRHGASFHPAMDAARVRELYAGWTRAVGSVVEHSPVEEKI